MSITAPTGHHRTPGESNGTEDSTAGVRGLLASVGEAGEAHCEPPAERGVCAGSRLAALKCGGLGQLAAGGAAASRCEGT